MSIFAPVYFILAPTPCSLILAQPSLLSLNRARLAEDDARDAFQVQEELPLF